jgi:hypothetical protein
MAYWRFDVAFRHSDGEVGFLSCSAKGNCDVRSTRGTVGQRNDVAVQELVPSSGLQSLEVIWRPPVRRSSDAENGCSIHAVKILDPANTLAVDLDHGMVAANIILSVIDRDVRLSPKTTCHTII